jgi:hypothetical protein
MNHLICSGKPHQSPLGNFEDNYARDRLREVTLFYTMLNFENLHSNFEYYLLVALKTPFGLYTPSVGAQFSIAVTLLV